jgi:deoxyribonuclease IV
MADPILGAHMSIAGGYHKALEAAAKAGMLTCQIFSKNNNQWRAKPITDEESQLFHGRLQELKIFHPLSHSSYLLNLASPARELWERSVDGLIVELQRAALLGIPHVVIHPGAGMGAAEDMAIAAIVKGLQQALQRTADLNCSVLLETTAGQGSSIGHKFEQIAAIRESLEANYKSRVAVCIDTCHLYAAGYPLASRKEYLATMRQLDRIIGFEQVKAVHLNDSKKDLGSRVDRHEHIGRGKIGLEAFRHLLNDRRFRDVPMYLETPKGTEAGEDLDVINLRTLRELVQRQGRRV